MSGAIDVLAGIRLAARDCRAQGNTMASNALYDIAAAVAELIECSALALSDAFASWHDAAARDRMSAALANAGGAK